MLTVHTTKQVGNQKQVTGKLEDINNIGYLTLPMTSFSEVCFFFFFSVEKLDKMA
jgi:hypothetical protein